MKHAEPIPAVKSGFIGPSLLAASTCTQRFKPQHCVKILLENHEKQCIILYFVATHQSFHYHFHKILVWVGGNFSWGQ